MAKRRTPVRLEGSSQIIRPNELRPQPLDNPTLNRTIALTIFLVSLLVYWITQNRSVTFWDVGEYIASSSILGVPHPPGNPFYIILGRFATILGFNLPHALIINSLSGLKAALAVMFTYLFSVKLISMIEKDQLLIYIGAIIAALYTAFSFTFWNNAIEASVYPGRDLVINFSIWLILLWVEKTEDFSHQNILLLIVYTLFIGFSIHQTTLQIVPAILLLAVYPVLIESIKTAKFWLRFGLYSISALIIYFSFIQLGDAIHIPDMGKIVTGAFFSLITYLHLKDKVPLKVWLWGVVFIGLALSPHIYLLVRSELRPFINEGHPHNLQLFSDYVLRRQYGVTSFLERRATFYYQTTHHFLRYLFWQFFHPETIASWFRTPVYLIENGAKMLTLILAFLGIHFQLKKNKHSFVYLFSFFFMTSIAMIFVMNLSDGEVRDRDYFFVSAYNLWAVWMGIGSIWIIRVFAEKAKRGILYLLAFLMLMLPIFNFASQLFIHNRSKEFIALDYGLNFLNSLEENAIVFTNGDNDTFPLWYAQAVYDPNSVEYVHQAKDVYPSEADRAFIAEAVENKRRELTGIRPDVTVANFSLLNTPWYIRHLRDIEGVRFNVPDEQIDNLTPMRVDRRREAHFVSPNEEDGFRVILPQGKILLIKDIAAIQIIRDNYGIRPLYFAVTVADEIVFEEHLRNEGMVNRIVSERREDQIDIERLRKNVEEIYLYRSIFDENVNKDENMRKLITNYGAAYMRISQYYNSKDDARNAAIYLEKAISFIDNNVRFYPALVQLYMEAEEYELALNAIDKALLSNPTNLDLYLRAALINLELENIDAAFDVFEKAVNANVRSVDLISYVFIASQEYQQYERGIRLLERMKSFDQLSVIPDYIQTLREEQADN